MSRFGFFYESILLLCDAKSRRDGASKSQRLHNRCVVAHFLHLSPSLAGGEPVAAQTDAHHNISIFIIAYALHSSRAGQATGQTFLQIITALVAQPARAAHTQHNTHTYTLEHKHTNTPANTVLTIEPWFRIAANGFWGQANTRMSKHINTYCWGGDGGSGGGGLN